MATMAIQPDRLIGELEHLARITDAEPPAVTRVLFTPRDLEARKWLSERFADAGLLVRQDTIGNLFARWQGTDSALPAVATGSHTDAIPEAGMYDGTVGVLGGLEAIRALMATGFKPRRSIELIMFTSEEPTRFGVGCVGSRVMSGALSAEAAAALTDSEGLTLEEIRRAAGCAGNVSQAQLTAGVYSAFVELHIEQGARLEKAGLPIGVVTAIAAPAALAILLEGEGGHAGAVLMPERRDALCGAAEVILAIEAAAKESGAIDSVATTGICEVSPGAINSIPNRVRMKIDVRDIDPTRRDAMLDKIRAAVTEVAARRGLATSLTMLNADPPATCAAEVIDAIETAARDANLPSQHMVSRAYHDSLFMARLAPTGMIFIPCRGGVSHRPDEYASPEHITAGVQVLAATLRQLAS
jgi:ureidoglycolate amidohydrolase